MTQQLQPVKVSEIVMNAGTQMRAYMNTEAISEYAALMKEGVEFDPVELYLVDDKLVLVNGFHRVNAAIKAGVETFNALITVGTMEEAIWASIAANKKNALKRNSSDVQRAIEAALLHPNGAALSDRQIADHVGCSHPTVGSVRAKLVATGKLSSSDLRTGKDGRSISTANIGSKHQMEHWRSLVLKPWLKAAGDADLHLIHTGDEYIHIVGERGYGDKSPILEQRYHLDYRYFSPRGSQENGNAVRLDRAYVELFEEDSLKVYVEEFKDLPDLMQRIAKAVTNEKYYRPELYTLQRVDPALKPGDKVAKITKGYQGRAIPVVGTIIGVSNSFVHVRRFGVTKDEIWFGSELRPLSEALLAAYSLRLTMEQWNSPSDESFIDEFNGLKEFYAPGALLFAICGEALITFGDDALAAAGLLNGISATDDTFGPVFITFDSKAIEALAEQCPFVTFDANRPTLKNFWQSIVAAQHPVTLAPAPAPAAHESLLTKVEAFEAQHIAKAAGDPRGAALFEIWYELMRIGEVLDELDPQDDEPLADAVFPLVRMKQVIGAQIGIDVKLLEAEGE